MTYQFAEGHSFAFGKRQRLREHGLWLVDTDEYYNGAILFPSIYDQYVYIYSYDYSLYIAFLRLWETPAAARTRSLARGHGRTV